MSFFNELANAIVAPLTEMLRDFVGVLDEVLIAAIVILFGYLLGWLLGNAVKHALHRMKFDEKFKQLHIAKPLEKIKISSSIGWIVKWYTFVVLAAAGARFVGLYPVTEIMTQFATWFPRLLIALAIGIFGAVLAEFVYNLVLHLHTGEAKILAKITKYFILVIFIVMALDQILDITVLERVLLILVGAISVGLALAIGISFGLALKDEAAGWIGAFKKK